MGSDSCILGLGDLVPQKPEYAHGLALVKESKHEVPVSPLATFIRPRRHR